MCFSPWGHDCSPHEGRLVLEHQRYHQSGRAEVELRLVDAGGFKFLLIVGAQGNLTGGGEGRATEVVKWHPHGFPC